jgi:hypothetical protein
MKLVEPIAVLDCYADGLGAVEFLRGGNVRFVMYVEGTTEEGEAVGVIVQKTVMSAQSVPDALTMAWTAVSGAFIRTAVKVWPLALFH